MRLLAVLALGALAACGGEDQAPVKLLELTVNGPPRLSVFDTAHLRATAAAALTNPTVETSAPGCTAQVTTSDGAALIDVQSTEAQTCDLTIHATASNQPLTAEAHVEFVDADALRATSEQLTTCGSGVPLDVDDAVFCGSPDSADTLWRPQRQGPSTEHVPEALVGQLTPSVVVTCANGHCRARNAANRVITDLLVPTVATTRIHVQGGTFPHLFATSLEGGKVHVRSWDWQEVAFSLGVDELLDVNADAAVTRVIWRDQLVVQTAAGMLNLAALSGGAITHASPVNLHDPVRVVGRCLLLPALSGARSLHVACTPEELQAGPGALPEADALPKLLPDGMPYVARIENASLSQGGVPQDEVVVYDFSADAPVVSALSAPGKDFSAAFATRRGAVASVAGTPTMLLRSKERK